MVRFSSAVGNFHVNCQSFCEALHWLPDPSPHHSQKPKSTPKTRKFCLVIVQDATAHTVIDKLAASVCSPQLMWPRLSSLDVYIVTVGND